MAAGKKTKPRLITLTAIILAVIRQVTKIAAIIINRCETLILNPVMTTEEIEHTAYNEYPDSKHKDKGKMVGTDQYMTKPFEPEEFLEKVRSMLKDGD